jgi:hypothetical protein
MSLRKQAPRGDSDAGEKAVHRRVRHDPVIASGATG